MSTRESILALFEEHKGVFFSGEEIAAKLGVTIHTVKQQKYLAYKFIKQELGKYWIVAMLFFL